MVIELRDLRSDYAAEFNSAKLQQITGKIASSASCLIQDNSFKMVREKNVKEMYGRLW